MRHAAQSRQPMQPRMDHAPPDSTQAARAAGVAGAARASSGFRWSAARRRPPSPAARRSRAAAATRTLRGRPDWGLPRRIALRARTTRAGDRGAKAGVPLACMHRWRRAHGRRMGGNTLAASTCRRSRGSRRPDGSQQAPEWLARRAMPAIGWLAGVTRAARWRRLFARGRRQGGALAARWGRSLARGRRPCGVRAARWRRLLARSRRIGGVLAARGRLAGGACWLEGVARAARWRLAGRARAARGRLAGGRCWLTGSDRLLGAERGREWVALCVPSTPARNIRLRRHGDRAPLL